MRGSYARSGDSHWSFVTTLGWVLICAVCGKRVSLETSKTDANGQAVHEDCYVSAIEKPLNRSPIEGEKL
jgi:hypothetical protein